MVCHRCCGIAVKLHKYRTNAVANDKLLKEQRGLPYTPPITNQEELFRVASKAISEENIPSSSSQNITKREVEYLSPTPGTSKIIGTASVSAVKFKSPEVKHTHHSIQKLFKLHKNIILPEEVFQSDISPVVSLDSAEVSDWYAEQLNNLKLKLKNIVFKEVPRKSDHMISTTILSKQNSLTTFRQNETTSRENSVNTLPKTSTAAPKRTVTSEIKMPTLLRFDALESKSRVVTTSDQDKVPLLTKKQTWTHNNDKRFINYTSDDDDIGNGEFHQLDSDSELQNDMPQTTVKTINKPVVHQSGVVSKSRRTSQNQCAKKRTTQRVSSAKYDIGNEKVHQLNSNSELQNNMPQATVKTIDKPEVHQSGVISKSSRTIQNQCAKKKTTQRGSSTKRKRTQSKNHDKSDNPKKNKSDHFNTIMLSTLHTLNLSQMVTTPVTEQANFCLPIEASPNEPLPELVQGKTLEIFMCSLCNKLYDTKKELLDHEKTHLKCKFCKKKMSNLQVLYKHQTESCYINIIKNMPFIKLQKVDCIPSIITKYAEAFQQSNKNEHDDLIVEPKTSEQIEINKSCNIEEVIIPMPTDTAFNEEEEIEVVGKQKPKIEQDLDVVCISDDSEDEIKCMEIPRHKIVNNPYLTFANGVLVSPPEQCQNDTVDLTSENPLRVAALNEQKSSPRSTRSVPSEQEMIRSLFMKHYSLSGKQETGSQTFTASEYNIKRTNTNLIILDGMFSELLAYKVPIQLECRSKVSAVFKKQSYVSRQPTSLEYWAYKEPIGVKNRVTAVVPRLTSNIPPNSTFLKNVFNTSGIPPRMHSMLGNFSKSLLTRKPSIFNRFTSTVTTAPSKTTSTNIVSRTMSATPTINMCGSTSAPATTTYNVTNAIPLAVSVPSAMNLCNGGETSTMLALDSFGGAYQPTSFVQLMEQSETGQCQGASVSQNNTSVIVENNESRDGHVSKVLHVNNNITNVNKIFVLAGNIQQIPSEISNIRYETSLLNNSQTNPSLPFNRPTEIIEVERVSQQSSTVIRNGSDEQSNNSTGKLRVRSIAELN